MMKKFMVYGLWFMVFFVFSIYYIPYTIYPAHAADSTPSADIRSKLEELKRDIASKAAKLKQEVNKKLQNKAYVGAVKTKSSTTLTLATDTGPKIVNINQDTVFESQVKNKKFSQKSVAEEDYLACLGDVDETGVLTAKKVILLPTPSSEVKTYLWGQIIAISDEQSSSASKLITLKNKGGKNIAVSVINQPQIKLGDSIILTGNFNKNEIFVAEFMFVSHLSKSSSAGGQVATKSASPSAKKKN